MRTITSRTSGSRRRVARALLAAIVAAALSACGDGGSSALALQASSTTAVTGGHAVTLQATGGSGGTPTWALSGPGALSASSGSTVDYLPPDGEGVDQAATVTVTVTSGADSQQVQIALAAATIAGHAWQVSREASVYWRSVAAGAGRFVAAGNHGLATSADGSDWLHIDLGTGTTWVSSALGPAGWLAIGAAGEVATSPDGVAWTMGAPIFAHAVGSSLLTPQVVAGNGLYVAVYGDTTYASTDGVAWTARAGGFASVAFGNGVFVAADGGDDGSVPGLYASTDGRQWTLTQPVPQALPVRDVAFGNGRFVAGNLYDATWTSSDGQSWLAGGVPAQLSVGALDFAGGSFYNGTTGTVLTTTDGAAWNETGLPAAFDSTSWVGARFAASGDTLVAALSDGAIASGPDLQHLSQAVDPAVGDLYGVDFADATYVAIAPDTARVLTSADGRTWTAGAPLPGGVAPWSIAHAPDGTFVVAGVPESILPIEPPPSVPLFATSPDGVHWTAASFTVVGARAAFLLHDGRRFVCVDEFGRVYASADGLAWSSLGVRVPQGTRGVQAVAYGNGRYVVVGQGGLASSSTDALAWTTAAPLQTTGPAPAALALAGVVFDGRRFVAVGAGGLVATSVDGQAWTVAPSATPQDLSAIAVAPGGVLVAVGGHGTAESSVDGVHWTVRATGPSQRLLGVVAGNGAFVAVGERGLIELSTH